MKKKIIEKQYLILAVSAFIGTTSYADNITKNKLAIGANLGTTGFSLEGRTPFTDSFIWTYSNQLFLL